MDNKKSGSGFVDWVKKHKKQLGLSAGALAGLLSILGATAYAYNSPKNPVNPLAFAQSEADVEAFNRIEGEGISGGSLKDSSFIKFIKKHKYKLGITAGLLSALGIGAIGAHNYKTNRPEERAEGQAEESKSEINRRLDAYYNAPVMESDIYGDGKKCKCGNCAKKIMKYFGPEHLAEMMLKHPKIGSGIISDLHSGITKGFNLVGKTGLYILVELAVGLLGPLSRPFVEKLIYKYGMKGLSFIKKNAHKGLTWIKDNVSDALKGEEMKAKEMKVMKRTIKGKGACCDQCKPFFENEFTKGNITGKDIEKMGGSFADDLGTASIWFSKNILAPALRIVPGSLGEALAYEPEHADKLAELISPGYRYEDPLAADKFDKSSYYGAYVAPTKQPKTFNIPSKKKDITAKPFIKGSGLFEKLLGLFPHRLVNSMIHENIREGNKRIKDKKDKKEGGKITSKKIYKLIPWDLLKALFGEVLDIPDVSILPDRMLDRRNKRGEGMCGGLPNPFSKPFMHDVPRPKPFKPFGLPKPRPIGSRFNDKQPVEEEAHILPFPYDGGRRIITPDHPLYDKLFNPNQPTQNPNFNESYQAPVKNINEEDSKFKLPKAGSGIRRKKKITKKSLKNILKF